MTVELHEEAEQELTAAFEWYEGQRPGLGDAFVTEFRRAVDRMLQFPGGWRRLSKRSRRCRLNRFPYGVVYQQREQVILIIAVMHLHRDPNYCMDRE